jgi:hypothetical protein
MNRQAHSIRVDFDDGDHLYTKIYGTTKEVMDHYSQTFIDSQEKPRKVRLVTFI